MVGCTGADRAQTGAGRVAAADGEVHQYGAVMQGHECRAGRAANWVAQFEGGGSGRLCDVLHRRRGRLCDVLHRRLLGVLGGPIGV